jgi:hypothetical protein
LIAAPTYAELIDSYLDLRWNMDPVAATAAGVRNHDHRLGVFGVEDVKQYVAALKSLEGALEECEVGSLAEEIDRTALLDELRFTVYLFEQEQPHVVNPTFWLTHVLDGLYFLLALTDRTHEERSDAAAGRVHELPGFLELASMTLRDCPAVFVETALQVAQQSLPLLDEVERELVPKEAEDFGEAYESARTALVEFSDHLRNDLLENGSADFAIGEDGFNFRLHFQHALRSTAPELWRYGLSLIEEVEEQLCSMAAEIEPGTPWRDLIDRFKADHPASHELVDAYDTHMERSRRFVEEHELVSVPDGALRVVATPAFLRPLIPFAAYQPPGAFSAVREGWFYVTPPEVLADEEAEERMLRGHCEYDLPSTALHEGYPGHHLQFLAAQALPSPVRKTVGTPLTIEGWALYCEEMMREAGFYSSVEERLFQKVALLWRACRIVLDVGLHTRGMAFGEAVDLLVDRVGFDRSQAESEVRRYCAEPTYQLCYAVGLRELMALRAAYQEAQGSDYSLRRFHDEVLGYGGLPVSLICWGMGLDA